MQATPIDFCILWAPNLKKVDYYYFNVYSKPIFIIINWVEQVSATN